MLHDELALLRQETGVESDTELTKDLHLYPDLHGKHTLFLSHSPSSSPKNLATSESDIRLLFLSPIGGRGDYSVESEMNDLRRIVEEALWRIYS